jgi:hypothetical protein
MADSKATATAKALAESYGYAYSFLKSDKSLWSTFQKAVKGNWPADHFAAAVKTTDWYKQNSETSRQFDYLKTTDPMTYKSQLQQTVAQIQDKASSLGASLSGSTLQRVAQNAMRYGWNDSQIQNTLAQYVKVSNGIYKGTTGNDIETVQATAYKNGINLSKSTVNSWAQSIASGNTTAETLQRQVRQMAKSLAPGYAKELDSGMDLQDIVSPYIESKAKLLEENPADIDMFDKDIRSAVSGVTKDGKPASESLWQFEQKIRQSPAWLKTSNAQDSIMAVAHGVLQDFGFNATSAGSTSGSTSL